MSHLIAALDFVLVALVGVSQLEVELLHCGYETFGGTAR
jgi:hypothetical protein